MATIPISQIVSTVPSVLAAGGSGVSFNGMFLSDSGIMPLGVVMSFATAQNVGAYFGYGSVEYALAEVYFQGYEGSILVPNAMLFVGYPMTAAAAFLQGASLSTMTLAQLQALTGTISLTVNGTTVTSSAINLSAATSFSNAATIIQAAFTSPPFTVTFNSLANAFQFTTTTTGSAATITVATVSSLSTGLGLTSAAGAVTSQGANAASALTFMNSVVALSQAWTCFTTCFQAVSSDMVLFAEWTSGQGQRYAYVLWDQSVAPTQSGDTTSAGYQITQAGYTGTTCLWALATHAAFVLGTAASIDTAQTNGRITFAFKSSPAGLAASVSNATTAANLITNGYSYYGAYAEGTEDFTFLYPGSVSGPYDWLDSYLDQIWLNSNIRVQLALLLTSVNSVPYNSAGYALIRAAITTVVLQAINFGAIRTGVTLSGTQAAEVNNAAGTSSASQALSTAGYFLLIQDPPAQVRQARGTPPITLWYMDGESVQSLSIGSILVQ